MAWRIEVTDEARKQLKKMGHAEARRIRNYLRQRIAPLDNPRDRGDPLTGQYAGFWRYRLGDYRIVCELHDEALRVLVIRVGHRRAVYR